MDQIRIRGNFGRVIVGVMLMAWLYFACVVWAMPSGGLGLHFAVEGVPVEGVGFSCYRVDEAVDTTSAGELKALTERLEKKIKKEHPEPDGTGMTDRDGELHFFGLSSGLYLVTGEEIKIENSVIRPQAFLAAAGEEMSQPAEVKYEKMMITQDPDPEGKLPQTGLLWGSISAVLCAGFFFIVAGRWIRKCEEKEQRTDEK